MELRRRIERKLEVARWHQEMSEPGVVWAYWHGYILACERVLEDITDLGIRGFERMSLRDLARMGREQRDKALSKAHFEVDLEDVRG